MDKNQFLHKKTSGKLHRGPSLLALSKVAVAEDWWRQHCADVFEIIRFFELDRLILKLSKYQLRILKKPRSIRSRQSQRPQSIQSAPVLQELHVHRQKKEVRPRRNI